MMNINKYYVLYHLYKTANQILLKPATGLPKEAFGEGSFYMQARTLATPIAVLSLFYCGYQMITSSDSKIIEIARKWFIGILGGIILLYSLPTIAQAALDMGE